LALFLAAGCASVPAGRSGSLSSRAYEPGRAFEDRTVALLGVGLFLSEPFLAPGLADPEARLLLAAGPLAEAARGYAGLGFALEPLSAGDILKTAFSQVGRPYKFGGTSPGTGFDCSGFVGWVYGRNGIKLPRSSPEMLSQGQAVARRELAPGDLVFFGRQKRVTHVGIYTGNNRYIHSPSRGRGIQESSLDDRARGEYYLGARRILTDAGLAPAAGAAGPMEAFQGAADEALEPEEARFLPDLRESAEVLQGAALARAETTPRLNKAPAAKPKTPEKAPPKTTRTHKVKAGDTLYDLARKYGLSQAELARANQLNPRQQASLRLGQVLKVPAKTAKN
jgi:LysM repeat protein